MEKEPTDSSVDSDNDNASQGTSQVTPIQIKRKRQKGFTRRKDPYRVKKSAAKKGVPFVTGSRRRRDNRRQTENQSSPSPAKRSVAYNLLRVFDDPIVDANHIDSIVPLPPST